jgi:hypothetical protein
MGLTLILLAVLVVVIVVIVYVMKRGSGCDKFIQEWKKASLEKKNLMAEADIDCNAQGLTPIYDREKNLLLADVHMAVSKDERNKVSVAVNDDGVNVNVIYGPLQDMVMMTVSTKSKLYNLTSLVELDTAFQMKQPPSVSMENEHFSFTFYMNLNDIPLNAASLIIATLGFTPVANLAPLM